MLSIPDHDPDTTTPSNVFINGTRIPIGRVDVHIRKEGGISITRYVEANFYSPTLGEHWIEVFNGTDSDSQSNWDTVRIDVLDTATQTYTTAFQGVVTGLGPSADDHEKEFTFRARGPGMFLDKVPAGNSFSAPSTDDILQYIADELSNKIPFDITVVSEDVTINARYSSQTESEEDDDLLGDVWGFLADASKRHIDSAYPTLSTPKRFLPNQHTLTDVISWVEDKTGIRMYFIPTKDGVTLVGLPEPRIQTHTAQNLGGDLQIVNNDALSEINPINTAIVKGAAKRTLSEIEDYEINVPDSKYHSAKVRHKALYERSGNTELVTEVYASDAESKQETVNEAISTLQRKLGKATGGDMQVLLKGDINPFDIVEAKPTCDSSVATSLPSVTYEVTRVHHKIRANEMPGTEINVGIAAPKDEIEIVDTWDNDIQ